MSDLNLLLDMLTYCRPADSPTEIGFIAKFIAPLGATRDVYGNWHVVIGDSDVLWSCHTDTVHHKPGRQTVHYSAGTGLVKLSKRSRYQHGRNCLGADDTAGVYLCVQLIKANVPGHYIFHYGEEHGGQGSSDLALLDPEQLAGLHIAIALDRRGTSDVITHQFGRQCASDLFAWSFADELNLHGFAYTPADGIYTDTAEYADVIHECTNLSVGYYHEHSPCECLDTRHLFALEDALIVLDYGLLCVDRVAEPEYFVSPNSWFDTDANDKPPTDYDVFLDKVYADVQRALQADKDKV